MNGESMGKMQKFETFAKEIKLFEKLSDDESNNLNSWFKDIELKKTQLEEINKCIKKCTSPKTDDIFNAFKLFKPNETKVLIIGQDPYPNPEKAQGLAFSHKKWDIDASLLNIFKCIAEYRRKIDKSEHNDIKDWDTNLENWAGRYGVLLLNTALTYSKNIKKEDRIKKWEPFIEKIIEKLLKQDGKLVVFLWGDDAKALFHKIVFNERTNKDLINEIKKDLLVLSTSHPSKNYSAYKKGFCYETPNHFKACDDFLKSDIWKDIDKYLKK